MGTQFFPVNFLVHIILVCFFFKYFLFTNFLVNYCVHNGLTFRQIFLLEKTISKNIKIFTTRKGNLSF